jgi:DedD protein
MADEGFREVQLNKKDLIFLFMTTAVVLVVTFLFGVMVGRGVRAQREPAVAGESPTAGALASADPTAAAGPVQPVAQAAPQAPPAAEAPPPAEEELSYYSRLDGQPAPGDAAKPAAAPTGGAAVPPPAATEAKTAPDAKPKGVPAAAAPKAAEPASASAAAAEPAGTGFVVRVAAYRDKTQAVALASRLSGKGYGAFVVPVSSKGAAWFSVRVGKFKTRKEADASRRRLEKEEQFKQLLISR